MSFRGGGPRNGRRYHSKWTKAADGTNHPSKEEAAWWDRMRLLERAGKILRLEFKPRFPVYIAHDCPHCRDHGVLVGHVELDGSYEEPGAEGQRIYVDYKGWEGETPLSKFKRKIAESRFGIKIDVVGSGIERAAQEKAKKELQKKALGGGRNR